MRFFDVTVNTLWVSINEVFDCQRVDFRANVDGEQFIYRVVRGRNGGRIPNKNWESVSTAVHYHAKNAGTVVQFEVSDRPISKSGKKAKVSESQMGLFDN